MNETFNNLNEIKKLQTNSILVESKEQAFNTTNGRVFKTEYKGMTEEQIRAIKELQEKQIKEKEVCIKYY